VAEGCELPFAPDHQPLLRLIETAWAASMPKRLQLDAALQSRLSALGRTSRWHRPDHGDLLAVAADPARHPTLQPRAIDIRVDADKHYGGLHLGGKNKNEQVTAGELLRSIVHLAALVHSETPAGHQARTEMPALIKQTTMLLDDPSTMLELRTLHIYDSGQKKSLKPSEWLGKHLGKTKANEKDGTARFDDGLIAAAALDRQHQALIAFRPAKLKDEADLARLQGILAIDSGDGTSPADSSTPIVAAIRSPGFQKLAQAIIARSVPGGQWPQNPRHTAAEVLKSIQAKCKLGEDAAMLYAQLLSLPDPTAANVRLWNGWIAAQLKAAQAELVGRKLVLEAVRNRAGRSAFLPGEWVVLKPPWLPIEGWKLPQLVELDLKPVAICPAGGPLVLRPFEDLFAAAWQRVVAGEGPRYEEATRRKKTK
jgi:hypothetical protein